MRTLPIAGLVLLLAACSPDTSSHEEGSHEEELVPEATVSFNSEIAGTEVTTITTEGGEVQLGLTDEVLYFGLTNQVAGEVEKGLDEAESEGGLGGVIAGALSNAVVDALSTPVQIPLADVRDVRYDDGRLVIEFDNEDSTVDLEINDEPVDQQFDPVEARRFAEAFHDLTGR